MSLISNIYIFRFLWAGSHFANHFQITRCDEEWLIGNIEDTFSSFYKAYK